MQENLITSERKKTQTNAANKSFNVLYQSGQVKTKIVDQKLQIKTT